MGAATGIAPAADRGLSKPRTAMTDANMLRPTVSRNADRPLPPEQAPAESSAAAAVRRRARNEVMAYQAPEAMTPPNMGMLL